MFKLVKPEIDGKTEFRLGMYININSRFADNTSVIDRLKMDDLRPVSLDYDEKFKPKYKFSKHYLNKDSNEIITERVFYVDETNAWFGVSDWRHGIFHFYLRMLSKYPNIKHENGDIGIFYRHPANQILVYTTNDSERVDAAVEWIFNNQKLTGEFMRYLKEMETTFKDSPYLGPKDYYPGREDQQTGMAIISI